MDYFVAMLVGACIGAFLYHHGLKLYPEQLRKMLDAAKKLD